MPASAPRVRQHAHSVDVSAVEAHVHKVCEFAVCTVFKAAFKAYNLFAGIVGMPFFTRLLRFFLGAASGSSIELCSSSAAGFFFPRLRFLGAADAPEAADAPLLFFQEALALFNDSLKLVFPAACTFFTCCSQVVMLCYLFIYGRLFFRSFAHERVLLFILQVPILVACVCDQLVNVGVVTRPDRTKPPLHPFSSFGLESQHLQEFLVLHEFASTRLAQLLQKDRSGIGVLSPRRIEPSVNIHRCAAATMFFSLKDPIVFFKLRGKRTKFRTTKKKGGLFVIFKKVLEIPQRHILGYFPI